MSASSAVITSPIGPLKLEADGTAVTGIWFHAREPVTGGRLGGVLGQLRRELDEYFAGTRKAFDVPLAPAGTPFQLDVWHALLRIPYGHTTTYGELAAGIGRPTAIRAVGAANGSNPIPLVIPCHRVIGRNGKLVGFGGGLDMKQRLLELEGARLF